MKLIVEIEVKDGQTGVQIAEVLCSVARTMRTLAYPLMRGLHGPISHDGKFLGDPSGWRVTA